MAGGAAETRQSDAKAGRRADALVLVAVALFFVCFFPQAVFGGKFLVAGDAYYYSLPLRAVAWQMLRAGELPLWTPHILSGFPLLAMPQLALGYPLTWPYAVLPAHWAEQIYVLAPYLLAPAFTYAYCRETGRTRLAALLAGLAFAYGGVMCGGISNSGMLTNSLMWLPLVLIGVERARGRNFAAGLVCAALAYSMSVLNGHAQSFTYVGLIVGCYGLLLAAFVPAPRRWRPLAAACGALALAAGLAAFQLFETARAARRSTRAAASYETLSEGSFRAAEAARAALAPLHALADVTPYVAPHALLLAAFACFATLRRRGRDPRAVFWLVVAAVAFLLMLGANTPLQRVVFHLPALNRFRVPSRHAFEWTFALSILAAYGFDRLSAHFARRRQTTTDAATDSRATINTTAVSDAASNAAAGNAAASSVLISDESGGGARARKHFALSLALLFAAACVGILWWRATAAPPAPGSRLDTGLPEGAYLVWKLSFASLVAAAALVGWRIASPRRRGVVLAACVLLGCFVEANAFVWRKWGGMGLDAARFAAVSGVTRALRSAPPAEGRVYTRVELFAEEFARAPRLEGPNLTALHGLHNVAGVEPLIQDRYSRALGGVGPDAVTPRAGFPANLSLFGPRSRVLDILNTTHVVSYSNLQPNPPAPDALRDGVRFAQGDLGVALPPGGRAELDGANFAADALAVVSSLSNSGAEGQGAEVARLRVRGEDGREVELPLRAGLETAEWAHERADVRPAIRHALAPVFDSRPGDEAASFKAHSYLARLPLGARLRVRRIEIENVSRQAWLMLAKATLIDTTRLAAATTPNQDGARSFGKASAAGSVETADANSSVGTNSANSSVRTAGAANPVGTSGANSSVEAADAASRPVYRPLAAHWERAFDANGALVLRNLRAQPRAWLVAEAEPVDGEEALRRIAGESERDFDPRRTALLEVSPPELPPLPGGELSAGSSARVASYGPNRLVIETESATDALLVVGEMFYPGWEATVDGREARIHLTNFLLRGVSVPAGAHRVEMRYRATAARNGAIISALSLVCFAALAWRARGRGR